MDLEHCGAWAMGRSKAARGTNGMGDSAVFPGRAELKLKGQQLRGMKHPHRKLMRRGQSVS